MDEVININQETIEREQGLIEDIRKLIRYKNKYSQIYKILKNGYEDPVSDLYTTRKLEEFQKNFPILYDYIKSGDYREISIFLNSQETSRDFILEDLQEKLYDALEKENFVEEVLDENKNVFYEILYDNGFMDENGIPQTKRSAVNIMQQKFENLSNILNSLFRENNNYPSGLEDEIANLANSYFVLMDMYLSKLSNIPGKELPKDGSIVLFNESYCREIVGKMEYIYNEINKKITRAKINDLKKYIDDLFFKEGGVLTEENQEFQIEGNNIQGDKPLKFKLMEYSEKLSIDNVENKDKLNKLFNGLQELQSLLQYLISYEGSKKYLEKDENYKNCLFRIESIIRDLEK